MADILESEDSEVMRNPEARVAAIKEAAIAALNNPEKIAGVRYREWLMSQDIPDENDNMGQTTTEAHKSGAKTSEKFETSCQDPETGRVVMPSICPFYTAMGENETTFNSYSYLPRDSERRVVMPSSWPSHAATGENEATSSSCSNTTIFQPAGGGLLLQHQGPQHAQLLVVYSRGCPPVYGHPLARQVWMGTPGTPMSMGLQPLMTLHPSTSNLPWSRLRTTVLPPSLFQGHHSTFLPAMCYGQLHQRCAGLCG
jgi:hypothetical protein